ncbi:MAG: SIS domain-containing protein [Lactovum sp.]
MLNFNKEKKKKNLEGALALRGKIEEVVDQIQEKGFDGIYFMGIGGTWASSLQVEVYMRKRSTLPIYVENAGEFLVTGNKKFTSKSVVVFSSVTGSTQEMLEAIKKAKDIGAIIFGFIDVEEAPLKEYCDYCISYPENEQLKFYMVANRLMYNNKEFHDYEKYNQEMEEYLPEALVNIEAMTDQWAKEHAKKVYQYVKEHPEMPHYFIGAGNQWGATYSYAMCYWEEQLWIRTKSITAIEFLHGTLEIVDAETPVILFMGEDEQRILSERVRDLLPKICRNYTFIDTKDYPLEGISQEYRGSISHLVMLFINNRLNTYLEKEFCHPMVIRRYYRQFEY